MIEYTDAEEKDVTEKLEESSSIDGSSDSIKKENGIHVYWKRRQLKLGLREDENMIQQRIEDAKEDLTNLGNILRTATETAQMSRRALEEANIKIQSVENRLREENEEQRTREWIEKLTINEFECYSPKARSIDDQDYSYSMENMVVDQPLPLPVLMILNALSSSSECSPSDRALKEMSDYGMWQLEFVQYAFIIFVSAMPMELPKWVETIMNEHNWWENVRDNVVRHLSNAILDNLPNCCVMDSVETSKVQNRGNGKAREFLKILCKQLVDDQSQDFLLIAHALAEEEQPPEENNTMSWEVTQDPAINLLCMAIPETYPEWILDLMDKRRDWWKDIWEALDLTPNQYENDFDCV